MDKSRRFSRRSVGMIPKLDFLNPIMKQSSRVNAALGDDWMDNDDFLE